MTESERYEKIIGVLEDEYKDIQHCYDMCFSSLAKIEQNRVNEMQHYIVVQLNLMEKYTGEMEVLRRLGRRIKSEIGE